MPYPESALRWLISDRGLPEVKDSCGVVRFRPSDLQDLVDRYVTQLVTRRSVDRSADDSHLHNISAILLEMRLSGVARQGYTMLYGKFRIRVL